MKTKGEEIELHKATKKELKEKLASAQSNGVSGGYSSMQAIEQISQMEAQVKFRDNEIYELTKEVKRLQNEKKKEMDQLKDKLEEYKNLYENVSVQIEEKAQQQAKGEVTKLKTTISNLELENSALQTESDQLEMDNRRVPELEKALEFFQNETKNSKA